MFDKLLERVTFEDLTAFCERFPEGVRAEYKREPAHIDKVIASVANTAGGFLVLGVRTDDKNMPVLPIEGMPARKGLEEQGRSMACGSVPIGYFGCTISWLLPPSGAIFVGRPMPYWSMIWAARRRTIGLSCLPASPLHGLHERGRTGPPVNE